MKLRIKIKRLNEAIRYFNRIEKMPTDEMNAVISGIANRKRILRSRRRNSRRVNQASTMERSNLHAAAPSPS